MLAVAGALHVVELLRCAVHPFLRSRFFARGCVIQISSFGLWNRIRLHWVLGFTPGRSPFVCLAAGVIFEQIRTLVVHLLVLILQHGVVRRVNAFEASADVQVPLISLSLQPLSDFSAVFLARHGILELASVHLVGLVLLDLLLPLRV